MLNNQTRQRRRVTFASKLCQKIQTIRSTEVNTWNKRKGGFFKKPKDESLFLWDILTWARKLFESLHSACLFIDFFFWGGGMLNRKSTSPTCTGRTEKSIPGLDVVGLAKRDVKLYDVCHVPPRQKLGQQPTSIPSTCVAVAQLYLKEYWKKTSWTAGDHEVVIA